MLKKIKTPVRVCAFLMIVIMLITGLGAFFQPIWLTWNNYYGQKGFYAEEKNTIETIFLGSSTLLNAANPIQMYEEYGISAYNLCSEQQPVLASYYWAQEAYRYHPESLKNIVFCISELRDGVSSAMFHKAFDNMKPSIWKYLALLQYNKGEAIEALLEMSPLYNYHHRWQEIEESEFEKNDIDPVNGTRGYHFNPKVWATATSDTTKNVKSLVYDETAAPKKLVEVSVYYFECLAEFCQDNGINLILTKTPSNNWDSSLHNAIQLLADKYSLTFLDFNFAPLYDEVKFIDIFDSTDGGTHMNCYGASKFTSWLGKYLSENWNTTDVRNDPDYAFMEDQLRRYKEVYQRQADIQQLGDVGDYLKAAVNDKTTVLITVRDSAESQLTDAQREAFRKLGLKKLPDIKNRDSYIAVIENGKVIYEVLRDHETTKEKECISYEGVLPDGTEYTLLSGGYKQGDKASCVIDGTEHAKNSRGINIVLYDNEYSTVVDSARFDTYETAIRDTYKPEYYDIAKSGEIPEELESSAIFNTFLKRFDTLNQNREADRINIMKKNNCIFDFIDMYSEDENNIIILTVKDEASQGLSEENRKELKEKGFEKLSALQFRCPYIGIMEKGTVIYEDTGSENSAVTYEAELYTVISAGGNAEGNTTSVLINEEEASTQRRGINVVVYNTEDGGVIDSVFFDTYSGSIHTLSPDKK